MNVVHHEIEVVGRPDDLPEEVIVDLSTVDIGTSIHVSQLVLPETVKVVHHGGEGDFTVATLVAPSGFKETEEAK